MCHMTNTCGDACEGPEHVLMTQSASVAAQEAGMRNGARSLRERTRPMRSGQGYANGADMC